jgi:hypothetical protein
MDDLSELLSLTPEEVEERSKTDPVLRRANELLDSYPTIRMIWYFGRLADAFVFIRDMLDVHAAAKSALLTRMMHGVSDLVEPYVLGDTPAKKTQAVEFARRLMEHEMRKKVDNYELWLLNQGLVALCTIMDAFLEHVVETVFKHRVELLYSAAEARAVDLKNIVKLGSVDKIVEHIRNRELKRFSFSDIEKRFAHLEKRLHLPVSEIFSWDRFTPEAAQQFRGWDLQKLASIYGQRHDVVHRDLTPIRTRSELDQIQQFFTRLVLTLSAVAKSKHKGVWSDMERTIYLAELYPRIKAEMEQGSSS